MDRSLDPAAARRSPAKGGREVRIGFVPLLDAAPLLVAQALGFFARHGVRVRLSPELGWGSIRERIAYGELDGAHAPGGIVVSTLLGTHTRPREVVTDLVLNAEGNAITLSQELWNKGVSDGRTLRLMVRSEAPKKPIFAIVSPYSSHYYLLRLWLERAGLDPDRDVRFAVLPPPLVADHMREGHIDGFCAGEPWNSDAALAGAGWIAATSGTLAPGHPEKVLLVTEEFHAIERETYEAVRAATVEACRFCDEPGNRPAVAGILQETGLFAVSIEALHSALVGPIRGAALAPCEQPRIRFHRGAVNDVTSEKASWMIESVVRTGSLRIDARDRLRCFAAFKERDPAPPDSRRARSVPEEAACGYGPNSDALAGSECHAIYS